MPQVTTSQTSRSNTHLADPMPMGTSGSSSVLSLKFHESVRPLLYQTFSHSPYETFLYSLGPSEIILPMLNRIYSLLALPDGWNGYEARAPQYDAVEYACSWVNSFYREVIDSDQEWLSPNVTASGEGEVVFEWWQGFKKLTVYVGNQSAEYIKVWGLDINTEMEDGEANRPDIRKSLWKWLMS